MAFDVRADVRRFSKSSTSSCHQSAVFRNSHENSRRKKPGSVAGSVGSVSLGQARISQLQKDICEALGYTNPSKAMTDHCKGITNRYPLQTAGGAQDLHPLALEVINPAAHFVPNLLRRRFGGGRACRTGIVKFSEIILLAVCLLIS